MMEMDIGCEGAGCACVCESTALENAWKLLTASKKRNFVAVQISPAVRVSIGERIGLQRGEDGVGKVVAALTALGADVVVDTAIASDALNLMRVKTLLVNKEAGQGLPLFSSECPGWVAHAKENYPEIAETLLPTATTVCAKLLKKYYSVKEPDKKIRVIALEAGEAKKADPGVDLVLSVDELAELLAQLGVNIRLMRKQPLTTPLGIGSGAGYIAAASGGDAEALARCLTSDKTQLNLRKFEYSGLYGKQERRVASFAFDGVEWNFAVVDSLAAADALIADLKSGEANYDYVEVTACAGGPIAMGCDLESEDGEMTRRLRKLGLKYLDFSRAARSADSSAAAAVLLKEWNAICRSGEAAAYDVIDEIVEDIDEPEEIVEEVAEETPVAEEVIEEAPVEEVVEEAPAEEVVEEIPAEEVAEAEEAPVEETVEEAPVEEVAEVEEAPVEEVVEEAPAEEVAEAEEVPVEETVGEAPVEEIAEADEAPVEETVEEAPAEEVAEAEEESVEEVVEEASVEEVAEAEEAPVEEVVEEAPVEEVAEAEEESVEDVVEEASVEEVAEAEEEPVEEVVEETPVEEVAEAEETPVEEASVEEVAETEEAPVEEVAEETPVEEVAEAEEAPVEDVVEEAPVEEVAEAEETPVEEVVEEAPVEEVAEAEEEPVEEVVEETIEDVFEEEVVEEEVLDVFGEEPAEAVEEVAAAETEETSEPAEETAEEAPAEEVAEVVEEPVEEEPEDELEEEIPAVSAEELAEEMKHVEELLHVAEEDLTAAQKVARVHYYRRLSTRDRRKLKRQKRKNAKNK